MVAGLSPMISSKFILNYSFITVSNNGGTRLHDTSNSLLNSEYTTRIKEIGYELIVWIQVI